MDVNIQKTWKQLRIWAIAFSVCILALGIVMVIWPDVSAIAVCVILGVFCICLGAVDIIRYFKLGLAGIFFRYDLILSIFGILIGILMLVRASDAVAFLPVAVGIYMIMGSVLCIKLAVELRRFQSGSWLLAMLWGVLGVILAFILLLDPFAGASILMIFAGIALIVGGIQDLYLVISVSKAIKDGKNGRVIEADWTNVN